MLYHMDIQVYLTNITDLSKLLYYESYEVEVDFYLNGKVTRMKTL